MRGELRDLYREAGFCGPLRLSWTDELERTHQRNARRYAQVAPFCTPPQFELAPQTTHLPAKHRRGLLAHEVGHVLDPYGSERDADLAAEEALGVRMGYDRRWPGRGLQVDMNPSAHERVREHFREWQATGDPRAYEAWKQARRRIGLSPEPESWRVPREVVASHERVRAEGPRRKRLKVVQAERVIMDWLRARGWAPDPRSRVQGEVWISKSGQRRMRFKRTHVVFERGGRGRWVKDYRIHSYGAPLGTIDFAERILRNSRVAMEDPYAPNPSQPDPLPPEPRMHVVCAWCPPPGTVIQEGDPGAPVSHGICASCFQQQVGELGLVPPEEENPGPRGTDARLRDLEREWQATGLPAAGRRYAAELRRAGLKDEADRVEVAVIESEGEGPERLPIVNPGDAGSRRPLFLLWFGAYGSTRVYVWADHFEEALEVAADWLAENAPGVFVDPEYPSGTAEAAAAGDYSLAEEAEVDLTYTESGWIPSWEWGGHEVFGVNRLVVCKRSRDEQGDE